MTWDITWGKSLEFLLGLKADGEDPQALRDRPVLDKVQRYYMSVFRELTDSRPYTQAQPIPIPLSEILAYCQLYYIEALGERERIVRMVRTLDNTFLKVTFEQRQADSKTKNAG